MNQDKQITLVQHKGKIIRVVSPFHEDDRVGYYRAWYVAKTNDTVTYKQFCKKIYA